MRKTTVLIQTRTRDLLKKIGRKNQTYDELIYELIQEKTTDSQGSLDRRIGILQPTESMSP
jgi:hypothetical protein